MASLRDIKRRIRTVQKIEKVTNAMKMVAAARLRKAQERAEAARPYAEKMQQVMQNLARGAGEIRHPLLEVRQERSAGFIVIGGERGLAGSYNENLMKKALREIGGRAPEAVRVVIAGKKAAQYFKKQPYEVVETLDLSGSEVSFADISGLTRGVRSVFIQGQVDAFYLVYSKFVSAMRQEPTCIKLLPVAAVTSGTAAEEESQFEFEPASEELLGRLLPRYVDTQIYQALVEAQASEQGARMTAMSSATKNAGEMIESLTLTYNKARQTAITSEIVEIVSGAEALK